VFIPLRAISTLGLALLLSACGHSSDKAPGGGSSDASVPTARPTATASNVGADDCNRKIDAAAAASILGVAKARENVYFEHTTQPPDKMDVLECGYSEASPNPNAPLMKYVVYAPIAADIPSVYSGLFRHPGLQSFNPNVGAESAGWVGPTSTPGLFQAYINFRTASNIFTIQVSGLPSADAAKSAVQKLAGSL
jgi:hypothetical protein